MKILLVGINAKFIHPNLAIRLLQANCTVPTKIMEWTIKDNYHLIANAILEEQADLIGISCYIWNIEQIKKILPILRKYSEAFILLGGPEVSFNPRFYIDYYNVDAVLCGEGEHSFPLLINALASKLSFENIPGMVSKTTFHLPTYIEDLNTIHSPYYLPCDYTNKIVYIETSRGCPFHCAYCLASLENHIRFFNLEQVKCDLLYLFNQGAKTFKFLDRTFNADLRRAKDLFSFLIENHPQDSVFQFEITGDIFPSALIDYINQTAPANLFRFEIGIQSTNETTNRLVNRMQNSNALFQVIKKLNEGKKVILHLDLIAGLPEEDLASFEQSFNTVIAYKPKECQLGFLKILKGTKLEKEINTYGYQVMTEAPYEIIENNILTKEDLSQIHLVEKVVDKCYNSGFMVRTMDYLIDHTNSFFRFCLRFGQHFTNNKGWLQYNLDDLFYELYCYLRTTKIYSEELLFLMKIDYLTHFQLKPKIWWEQQSKQQKNSLLDQIYPLFLTYLPKEEIRKYGIIETCNNQAFFIYYKNDQIHFKIFQLKI